MISPDIQAPEDVIVNIPEPILEPVPPIPLRRSKNIAESIAYNTKANGVPLEQVVSMWGLQRGIHFVDELLAAQVHSDVSEKEKDRLRRQAARAIAHTWIEKQGFTASIPLRHDKIYPFWNAGWKM